MEKDVPGTAKWLLLSWILMVFSNACRALPFSIIPELPLPEAVPVGGMVYAYYTVSNNTNTRRNNNIVKYLPNHVTQITTNSSIPNICPGTFSLAAKGQPGSTCTLQLKISGPVNAHDTNPHNHLFVCFPGGTTCAGTAFPLNVMQYTASIDWYQNWITGLNADGYKSAQGNAFLMTNNECPEFVQVFDSCFGQNPAAPYVIPQPPVEDSYVDPAYAAPFNTPGPDGETNVIYRLGNQDALITIMSYPPKAAYFGYQSYVFTSETSNYTGITPPRSRTVSPDPARYELFGSLGNDINNVITENQYVTPWGGTIVMYITTPNRSLAEALIANANSHGINPESIFVEPVGSNVITGNGSVADDMITLMRYAVPESSSAGDAWINQLSHNVLVYKVSRADIPVNRFGANQYTPHTVNQVENTTSLSSAQQQLAALLQTYLATAQSPLPATYGASMATCQVNAGGVPTSGLVGSYCIYYGVDCEGDNQDTSTYAILTLKTLGLDETAFIVGVDHSALNLNNNRYTSVDIYNAINSSGVASSSQTNPPVVGFDSGNLTGSAQAVLQALGIAIPPSDTDLRANLSSLYVSFIARNCNNPTIAAASPYCINLQGFSLIPPLHPITITERSYIMPGTTSGGNVDYMLYPIIVAATNDFE